MTHSLLRAALCASLLMAAGTLLSASEARGQECGPNGNCGYSVAHLDLFYNYYVGPGACGGGIPAQLYLSPRPTPPWVGHTYVTYQPLMPHEFLYKHHRTYTRLHPDGSATRTRVRWH